MGKVVNFQQFKDDKAKKRRRLHPLFEDVLEGIFPSVYRPSYTYCKGCMYWSKEDCKHPHPPDGLHQHCPLDR